MAGGLLLPWIVVIAVSGLYLNHRQLAQDYLFTQEPFSLPKVGSEMTVTPDSRLRQAQKIWPNQAIEGPGEADMMGVRALVFEAADAFVILPLPKTNVFVIADRYGQKVHSLDGTLIRQQRDWNRILRDIHKRGWLGTDQGTWLADLVAIAMLIFSLSGLAMWVIEKRLLLRRHKVV